MLEKNFRLLTYNFNGYWKDVGTIESLWKANMDLLESGSILNPHNSCWKIYTRNATYPPHYVGYGCEVKNSIITEGCRIYGDVSCSVLSPGVLVEKGASIKRSIVMADCVVKSGACVAYSVIGADCYIGKNTSIGINKPKINDLNEIKITVLGPNTKLNDKPVILSKYIN